MSEAPRLEKSRVEPLSPSNVEPLSPSNNDELYEIAWQKWIKKNKERDAAQRIRLIRMLWIVSVLVVVSAVVWRLTLSK
jgi:hypothetical protein